MWNDGSRKVREWEKNHGLLTLWKLLKFVTMADVEVGQSFAITEPFGHCEGSELNGQKLDTEQISLRWFRLNKRWINEEIPSDIVTQRDTNQNDGSAKYKFENEKNSLLTLWVRLQLVNENWRIWLKRWVRSILRCKTRNKRSFFQGGTASSFRFTRSPMRSGGLVNLENLNCYECLSLPSLPEGMSVFSHSCSCELPGQSLNHPTSRFSFLHASIRRHTQV